MSPSALSKLSANTLLHTALKYAAAADDGDLPLGWVKFQLRRSSWPSSVNGSLLRLT